MTPAYLIPSPLGDMALRIEDDFLTGLFFVGQKYFPPISLTRIRADAPGLALAAQRQVTEFFTGERRVFTVPTAFRGTAFQRTVWKALSSIPYGSVVSYSDIAHSMGLTSDHARAVGSAVGHNPISLIVPCHRVVAASGHLTGYAGGIHRKAALLRLEHHRDTAALSCRNQDFVS